MAPACPLGLLHKPVCWACCTSLSVGPVAPACLLSFSIVYYLHVWFSSGYFGCFCITGNPKSVTGMMHNIMVVMNSSVLVRPLTIAQVMLFSLGRCMGRERSCLWGCNKAGNHDFDASMKQEILMLLFLGYYRARHPVVVFLGYYGARNSVFEAVTEQESCFWVDREILCLRLQCHGYNLTNREIHSCVVFSVFRWFKYR